jgi:hypothetical protein
MITSKLLQVLALLLVFSAAVTTATAQDVDELAAKGPGIAAQDPLALELRNQLPDALARRGFDIGMAAAEGQTAPGPGKQRIHDGLSRPEQVGFRLAVLFSLERNRQAEFAATGGRIARSDERVAAARNAETDVFFKLGFDIASGIFGPRALGAQGNTLTGPGSLGIRDSLSSSGQRGFNAAVNFYLGQTRVDSDSVTDRGGPERVNNNPGGVGKIIEKTGAGAVIDVNNSRLPNTSKRLILSAAGSATIQPVQSAKLYLHQDTTGEIFLAVTYEDGTPFTQARPENIHIELLPSTYSGPSGEPALDVRSSRANDGVWHFVLPKLQSGSRFYLVSVVVDVKAWRTTFEGRTIVRVDYTRMPFWNAQRSDGTIWDPPK